jgi:cytochrome c553
MLKPTLVIIATMCLSWGMAVVIHTVRGASSPSSMDMVVACARCHTLQRVSTPVYSCVECGRVQVSRAISR